MNLCGGITSISEYDLLLQIPIEEFGLPPRRRKNPSVGNSAKEGSAAPSPRSSSRGSYQLVNKSTTTQTGTSSTMLNPVSKDDMAKLRSRQQQHQHSHPLRGMKSSSILMKKLESGFNVTWLDKEGKGQAVNLSTNSDKSGLRIRSRSRDESDNENDGFKSNQGDIRLKIRHIARIGSDRERTLGQEAEGSKSTSYFMIKMKQSVGEWVKFKFVAESLAERDAVVLAIRRLMDETKYQMDERNRKASSIHDRHRGEERPESRSEEHNDASRTKDSRDCDFDTTRSSDRNQIDEKSARLSRRIDRRISLDDSGRYSRGEIGGKSSSTRKMDSQSKFDHQKKCVIDGKSISLDDIKDEVFFDSLGCNAINCQSHAFTAVEDGELMSFAANQIAGPWCTDDVCTASLTGFADSMKGIFDTREAYKYDTPSGRKQRATAERYISDFLGDNTTMSELLSVKDLWTIAETKHANGTEIQKRSIQNRARNMDGKALRLKNLRTQMTFHGSNVAKKMAFLQTTSSFDDVNRCGKWDRRAQSNTLQIAGQFDASTFLDKDLNESEGNEVLCYDSDPEGARERTLKRGPRRAIAERENAVDDSTAIRREALNILGSSRFGLGRKWRRHGDEVVLDIIEATKNERFTLMWHPTQTNEKTDLPAVVCVKLWVEAGVYLVDGTFLLPKLTWLPVHESNLHARVLNTSEDTPGSMDLLDVCRVKECETIDRNAYPFAHVDRSFVIQTQTGKHLFETQSTQERGRVVNGLKLVIARLASLLMLRDLRAVDEFFGGNNSVPGEAPVWARSEKSDSLADFPQGPR